MCRRWMLDGRKQNAEDAVLYETERNGIEGGGREGMEDKWALEPSVGAGDGDWADGKHRRWPG
jgi:hypothetical protein